MKEYHCEFCGATGTELRDEKKGCCNNCGAPIGITKEQAEKVYDDYFRNFSSLSTCNVMYPTELIEVTSLSDSKRVFIKGLD